MNTEAKSRKDRAKEELERIRKYGSGENLVVSRVALRMKAMGKTAAELGREWSPDDGDRALAIARKIRDVSTRSSGDTIREVAGYLALQTLDNPSDYSGVSVLFGGSDALDERLIDWHPER